MTDLGDMFKGPGGFLEGFVERPVDGFGSMFTGCGRIIERLGVGNMFLGPGSI